MSRQQGRVEEKGREGGGGGVTHFGLGEDDFVPRHPFSERVHARRNQSFVRFESLVPNKEEGGEVRRDNGSTFRP